MHAMRSAKTHQNATTCKMNCCFVVRHPIGRLQDAMGTPTFRVVTLAYLHKHAPTVCHARMFESAAFQASGGCLCMYAQYLEEMLAYSRESPQDAAVVVLRRAMQPLLQEPSATPLEPLRGASGESSTAAAAEARNVIVCPRCRGTTVMPFEKQRRSADEPAHQFGQCLNEECRHMWLVAC